MTLINKTYTVKVIKPTQTFPWKHYSVMNKYLIMQRFSQKNITLKFCIVKNFLDELSNIEKTFCLKLIEIQMRYLVFKTLVV